jgi:hypothetical protein
MITRESMAHVRRCLEQLKISIDQGYMGLTARQVEELIDKRREFERKFETARETRERKKPKVAQKGKQTKVKVKVDEKEEKLLAAEAADRAEYDSKYAPRVGTAARLFDDLHTELLASPAVHVGRPQSRNRRGMAVAMQRLFVRHQPNT